MPPDRALLLLTVALMAGCNRGSVKPAAKSADPGRAIRHNNLGVSLMDQGMAMNDRKYFAQAVKEFERAAQSERVNDTMQTNLARSLYFSAEPAQESAIKNYDRARATLNAALKADPANAGAHFMLGLIHRHDNREAEALASFREAARRAPGDWSTHYQVGALLFRQGKFKDAEISLRKALELNPGSRAAAYQLFMSLQRQGKSAEAQKVDFARLPEGPQGEPNYFYLRPGKLTEAVAIAPDGPRPEPVYGEVVDATKQFNLNFKHGGCANDPEVAAALSGKPMPRAWFIKNKLKLVSAIGSGVAAGDFDGDDWCDVFFPNCFGKSALLRNDHGKFVDMTATAGVGGNGEMAMAAVWGDYDNDGKLDLLVTFYGGATLYRNEGAGKFADVTSEVGLRIPKGTWCTGAAFADVDHDADLDLYVCGYVDMERIPTRPTLKFPHDFAGARNFLFRNNTLDKTKPKMPGYGAPKLFTEIAKEAKVTGDDRKALGVVFSDFNEDNAVDFYVVNDGQPNQLFWNVRDRTFREVAKEAGASIDGRGITLGHFVTVADEDDDGFIDIRLIDSVLKNVRSRGLPAFARSAVSIFGEGGAVRGQALADLNNDGVPDSLASRNGERAKATLRQPGPAARYLKIRANARSVGESPQSNRSSIGAKIEVLAPGVWQKREIRAGGGYLSCDSFDLCFDLGAATRADFVRGIWPSGIRGSVVGAKAGTVVGLDEPAGIPPSCPYVYVWNGARFEFLADTLAGGTLGELISPTQYLPLDPDEWLKIDGNRFAPRQGEFAVRLVNQNPETDFVDEVRLLAIDHPAGVEIFPNERMTGPPFPQFKVWAVRDAHPPIAATDDAGRDVLERVSKLDRNYHSELRPLPWRGFAQPHSLALDLGAFSPAHAVLLLTGYIDWGGSSTALGAGQAGVEYLPPRLEVIGRDGRWQLALADMGYPAGRARTVVVPLAGLFPTNDHRVRISTNMMIYWDEIRVATADPSPLTTHPSRLSSASVRWLGYPRAESLDGKQPPIPNYADRDAQRDYPTHTGAFTRYGEVAPLVRAADDEYVILNHGDELALRFGAELPTPRPGWKRDYLAYFFGYGKSVDVNTYASLNLWPLPYRAMTGYPYSPGQPYPFARHADWWARYQTRLAFER